MVRHWNKFFWEFRIIEKIITKFAPCFHILLYEYQTSNELAAMMATKMSCKKAFIINIVISELRCLTGRQLYMASESIIKRSRNRARQNLRRQSRVAASSLSWRRLVNRQSRVEAEFELNSRFIPNAIPNSNYNARSCNSTSKTNPLNNNELLRRVPLCNA